jgi:hypothetical protein
LYKIKVIDSHACVKFDSIILKAPDSLRLMPLLTKGNCFEKESGIIDLSTTMGGVKPFLFNLNNFGFESLEKYTNMKAGSYSLKVKDANDCEDSTSIMINESIIPNLSLDTTKFEIKLGEKIYIKANTNIDDYDLSWNPTTGIDFSDQLNPIIFPLSSSKYSLKIISSDGCIDSVEIDVRVKKIYEFIFANVISMSSLKGNKFPKYSVDESASRLEKIEIYDRWGSKLLSFSDLPLGTHYIESNTQLLENMLSGVYTWRAKVHFIDGVIKNFFGSLTILR